MTHSTKVYSRSTAIVAIVLCVSASVADTPAHLYAVWLPGNEDLEKQIDAIPWTTRPGLLRSVKDVSRIDFSGRDLRRARVHFQLNGLYGAKFDNCSLDGSTFSETVLSNCSFRNSSLRFCEVEFSYGPPQFNDFTNADITGSSLWAFPENSLKQTKNYRERRMVGITLNGSLMHVSFQDFCLRNVTFPSSSDAFKGCDVTNAILERMMIFPSFSEEQIRATKNYQNRDLSELLFVGSSSPRDGVANRDFRGWDFSECTLAYFKDCDLTNAGFDNAFFLGTEADNVQVIPSSEPFSLWHYYAMVRLADIGFDGCVLGESQLRQTANWKRKDLGEMHLKNMVLDGWDFSGILMVRADLSGSSLKGTKFAGAHISGLRLDQCDGLTVDQLLQSHTHSSKTREDIVRSYFAVDFVDLTDQEKELQESARQEYLRTDRGLNRLKPRIMSGGGSKNRTSLISRDLTTVNTVRR